MASTTSDARTVLFPLRKRRPYVIIKELCDHSKRFDNPYVFISNLRASSSSSTDKKQVDESDKQQDEHDAQLMREQFVKTIPNRLRDAWNFLIAKDGLRIVRNTDYKQTLDLLTDEHLMAFYQIISFLEIDPAYSHTKWKSIENDFEEHGAEHDKQSHALSVFDASLVHDAAYLSEIEQWFIDYTAVHRLPELLRSGNGNLSRSGAELQKLLGIKFDIPAVEFEAYVKHFSSIANLETLTFASLTTEIEALEKKNNSNNNATATKK